MKKFLRLLCILSVLTLGTFAHAGVHIQTVGVNNSTQCPALPHLLEDLNTVQFPDGWTIYLSCTTSTWDAVQQHFDVTNTGVAFSTRTGHYTVVNGDMYRNSTVSPG